MRIYHNPRCSKSRQTLALLKENGLDPEVVLYMDRTLTSNDLKSLLMKLRLNPIQLVRRSEAIWKANFKGKTLTDAELIAVMIAHPKLIERPIVVKGKRAVLGRPPENVLELI
tara:strand:- start:1093 stop:1431 length:339 start_codon:yes stop_codon:yes gene_type:complete